MYTDSTSYIVPLFTDVAGTVRSDCTVPEDVVVSDVVIPRANILE